MVPDRRRVGPSKLSVVADDQIEWLNTDDAAHRLGITTRTLYRFIDQGKLPSESQCQERFGEVTRVIPLITSQQHALGGYDRLLSQPTEVQHG